MFKTKEELRAPSARRFVVRKKIVWSYVEKVLLVLRSLTQKNGFVHPIGERSWIFDNFLEIHKTKTCSWGFVLLQTMNFLFFIFCD